MNTSIQKWILGILYKENVVHFNIKCINLCTLKAKLSSNHSSLTIFRKILSFHWLVPGLLKVSILFLVVMVPSGLAFSSPRRSSTWPHYFCRRTYKPVYIMLWPTHTCEQDPEVLKLLYSRKQPTLIPKAGNPPFPAENHDLGFGGAEDDSLIKPQDNIICKKQRCHPKIPCTLYSWSAPHKRSREHGHKPSPNPQNTCRLDKQTLMPPLKFLSG